MAEELALRDEKGRFLKGTPRPEGAAPLWDSEGSLKANEKRWKMAEVAADEALMSHPDMRSPKDGLKSIFENQIVLANSPDAGSAATGAARFVIEKGGYDRKGGANDAPTMSIEIRSERVAEALAKRIAGDS